jgi:hypothetical protein
MDQRDRARIVFEVLTLCEAVTWRVAASNSKKVSSLGEWQCGC